MADYTVPDASAYVAADGDESFDGGNDSSTDATGRGPRDNRDPFADDPGEPTGAGPSGGSSDPQPEPETASGSTTIDGVNLGGLAGGADPADAPGGGSGSGSSGRGFDPAAAAPAAAPAIFATQAAADVPAFVSERAADVREFQRNTTPVQDAGAAVRDQFGIPSEADLAAGANEAVETTVGTSPRQARLGVRSGVVDGVGSGVDAAADTVPGGRDTLVGAATVAAVAEPTPFGEALLLGTGAATGIGGATASNPQQGRDLVPESPFGGSELDVGEADQDVDEITQPSEPTGSGSELGVGGTQPTEVDVPDQANPVEVTVPGGDGATNLLETRLQQLVGEEELFEDSDAPTITRDDLVDERGDPRQDPPSTRERQRRDDLDVFERQFPGRENQIIGRGSLTEFDDDFAGVSDDVVGQGTDVTTGSETVSGSGVGPFLPPFADVGTGTDSDATQPTDTTLPPATGTPTDTDAPSDTGSNTGERTVSDTVLVQGSVTVDGFADPASADFGAPTPTETVSEPVDPTPPNPSGFGRGDGSRRRPLLEEDGQEPDGRLPMVAIDEDVVTNPTRSLDAVSEDLREVFDGGPDGP